MLLTTTLTEFTTYKKAAGKAPRTLSDYRRCLGHFLEWCNGQNIDDTDGLDRHAIRAYAAGLRDSEWAPGTIGLYIRNLRTWLNWLHNEGFTAVNLAQAVPQPATVVSDKACPERDTLRALIGACIGDDLAARDRSLILLMASTGLRRGEIVLLQLEDVHIDDGWLRAATPKTGGYRFAFLTPEAQDALSAYLDSRDDDNPALFMDRNGNQALGYDGIYHVIRRRAQEAGIDPTKVNPHSFRVFLATEWVAGGGDEQRLLKLMGWSSSRMLDIYVRAGRRRDLQDAHKKHAPRLLED